MEKKIIGYLALSIGLVLAVALFYYYNQASEPITSSSWIDSELRNVLTQETFKLSDFDKPILLESFAVWCPTCRQQQDQIQKLIDEGDESIHISINTDPNEDESQVIAHINRYSYTWSFAIAPVELTKELIAQFGTGVVNAPRAPVILICPNGMSRLLKGGVKTAQELKEEINTC